MQRLHSISSQLFQSVTSDSNSLVIVERQNTTAIIHLNQPKSLNNLSSLLIERLNKELETLDKDPKIKVLILMGTGRCFCAGANLKQLYNTSLADTIRTDPLANWFKVIPNLKKPIIAAVHGMALGGGFQLAMMCDIIIADSKANFGLPQVKVGLIPGAGGTQKLIREIGKSRAMQLILTGEYITAEKLAKMGLISQIVESRDKSKAAEGVKQAALNLAKKMSKNSSVVMAVAKKMISKSQNLGLDDGLQYERMNFHKVMGLKDASEGIKAFIEKRKPEWKQN